jgi:hypothetical protein
MTNLLRIRCDREISALNAIELGMSMQSIRQAFASGAQPPNPALPRTVFENRCRLSAKVV